MTAMRRPEELAQLRAELAAQRAVIATQQARLARVERHGRLPRRALSILIATLLFGLMPPAMLAANPFTDLNPTSVHNPNIDAIYAAGITTGCDPGVAYCPNGLVTREEMASFLARAAGLGGNPPVANAKTAQNAVRAVSADTAGTVGGYAPNALLRVGRGVGVNRADTPPPFNRLTITQTFSALPLPTSLQPVVSVEVAAPAPGFVLVTGAVYIQLFANGSLSPAFVFPVGMGSQTFTLEVVKQASLGTAEAYDGVITALYIPFGYDGGTALQP